MVPAVGGLRLTVCSAWHVWTTCPCCTFELGSRGPFETKEQKQQLDVPTIAVRRRRCRGRGLCGATARTIEGAGVLWPRPRVAPRRSRCALRRTSLRGSDSGADSPAVACTVLAFSNIGTQQFSIQATLAKKCFMECWNRQTDRVG